MRSIRNNPRLKPLIVILAGLFLLAAGFAGTWHNHDDDHAHQQDHPDCPAAYWTNHAFLDVPVSSTLDGLELTSRRDIDSFDQPFAAEFLRGRLSRAPPIFSAIFL